MFSALPIALSGGANGVPVAVAATTSPGTTIHTATSIATANYFHKLWVWFNNIDTVARTISVQWGGVANLNYIVLDYVLPPKSKNMLIVDGLILQNGLLLKAHASAANIINASGHGLEMAA